VEQQTMMVTVEGIADQIKAGEYEEARQTLDSIGETDENRCELRFLRGYLQELTYEREAALATYEEVLKLDADHSRARFRAAVVSDLLGDDDAAIVHYEKCVAEKPARVNALINLAVLYEECGRLREAECCLESVLAEYPNHRRAKHFLKSVDSSYTMRYDEVSQREREHRSAILDTPISDFELSVRSRNCLRQMDIKSLGDLLRTTEAELLSYKNFGETSLNEIKAMLRQKGLSLGQGLQPIESSFLTKAALMAETSAFVNKPVAELELSVRSRRCLQSLGVNSLGELAMCSEVELMETKNFGQTSLNEIKRQLAIYGLSFRS
jgi:DNA-directed RNA polymerase subunit alpha